MKLGLPQHCCIKSCLVVGYKMAPIVSRFELGSEYLGCEHEEIAEGQGQHLQH